MRRREDLTRRMVRLTLGGPELAGLVVSEPAASVRLLVPAPGAEGEVELPAWDGNVFLQGDGRRAPIRTFTPLRLDPEAQELDLEIVLHGPGAASSWAAGASPGDGAALSGPARGYSVEAEVGHWLIAGDETAIPAIGQLLAALAPEASVEVHVEVAEAVPVAAEALGLAHPGGRVEWHVQAEGAVVGDAMVRAVVDAAGRLAPDARVWVAGEAAAVQRIRRHLFEERGLSRRQATVRGYWKHGRAGDAEPGADG